MDEESIDHGYEIKDASARWLFATGAALLMIIALSLVFLKIAFGDRIGPRSNSEGQGFGGGATAQTAIEEDWRKLDAEVTEHLTGYRWINHDKGVVQIPIERAMERLTQEGEKP